MTLQKRVFHIEAIWDPEAGVFYSESDIEGLHIEATTIEEFTELFTELAPDLIESNHMNSYPPKEPSAKDLMSTVFVHTPAAGKVGALG